MRRGPKPAKPKEAKPPAARKSPKDDGATGRDLETRLAETEQREVEALKREAEALKLKAEAQEQQAATAEILQVIRRSPTEAQPVFEAIVRSAVELCDARAGALWRFDGSVLTVEVIAGGEQAMHEALRGLYRRPTAPRADSTIGRAILEARVVHIRDIDDAAADWVGPAARDMMKLWGLTSLVSVPMLRDGVPIGVFNVARTGRPFSDAQVALLETFADQAVIAIENVRLFNETKEALGRQTATAEILRVIASAPTELQPALDATATTAALVCDAYAAVVFLREDDHLHSAAHYGPITITVQHTTLSRASVTEAAILDRQPVHVRDLLATEPPAFPITAKAAREGGFRTCLSVPLLCENEAIGALAIRRREVQPFTTQQIELLKTFADQAVIAIENVRLFTELQEKNRALTQAHAQTTEALEQQTATSEILRVISESPTDVQPVFEVIAAHACRLCDGVFANVIRFDGTLMHNMAENGFTAEAREFLRRAFPSPPSRSSMSGRAILAATVVYVEDVTHDMEPGVSRELGGRTGHRAMISVPMLHDGAPVGAITVARLAAGQFGERQVNLLKT